LDLLIGREWLHFHLKADLVFSRQMSVSFFCSGVRACFVKVGKILAEPFWRALAPEQKKRNGYLGTEDKVRFQMEMQPYTANQQAQAGNIIITTTSASGTTTYRGSSLLFRTRP
jgi:hypothetical protein